MVAGLSWLHEGAHLPSSGCRLQAAGTQRVQRCPRARPTVSSRSRRLVVRADVPVTKQEYKEAAAIRKEADRRNEATKSSLRAGQVNEKTRRILADIFSLSGVSVEAAQEPMQVADAELLRKRLEGDWDLVVVGDDVLLELAVPCVTDAAALTLWEQLGSLSVEDYLSHHLNLEASGENLLIQVCANRPTYEPEEGGSGAKSEGANVTDKGSMFVCKSDFVLAARLDQQLASEAAQQLVAKKKKRTFFV